MRLNDIPFAIRLTNLEHWGIERNDLERIIRLSPEGSFVAYLGTKRVGMLTTTRFGRKIAWIGNVVVKRAVRGRHIGQKLVEHALDYLRSVGVRHVAVYCFLENVRFYERLGFVIDVKFVRLHRNRRAKMAGGLKNERQRDDESSSGHLFNLDRRAFGADRSPLFDMVLREGHGRVLEAHGQSALLVKVYENMYEFGPWVGFRRFDYQKDGRLIDDAVLRYSGKPIEASCLLSNRKVLKRMKHDGFCIVNVGYRMYHIRKIKLGRDSVSYLLGFLDKG